MDVIQMNLLPLIARALVVAAIVWVTITGVRLRRGMPARTAISKSVSEALIAVSVVVIWGVTLAPVDVFMNGATPRHLPINLVPILPLLAGLADPALWRENLANVVGNLLLFAPIGFGVRWRFELPMWSILLIAAGGSALVEVAQAVSDEMRSPDINDIILNALGAMAGAWAFVVVSRLLSGRSANHQGEVALPHDRPS